MASPVDAARTTTGITTAADPWTVNLPASIAADDLLVMVVRCAGVQTFNTPPNWTALLSNDTSDATDDVTSIFYKVATGGEGATVSVDLSAAGKGTAHVWRVTGAKTTGTIVEYGLAVTTTGSDANPPSISPAGGSKDYLFLVHMGLSGETQVISAAPSGYSNLHTANSGTGGSAATNTITAGASKQATTATEDPGTFTHTDADTTGIVIAVHPAGASAYTLDAQPGTFTLTGVAAPVVAGRVVSSDPGSYALSGTAASAVAGRVTSADPGSFALAGTDATVVTTRLIDASPGAYTLTGVDAALAVEAGDHPFNAEPGSFVLTGAAATVPADRAVDAAPGAYALTGTAASILADRTLEAAPTSYALTGAVAGVPAGRVLEAVPAAYVMTGVAITTPRALMVSADPGAYVFTGVAAGLIYTVPGGATSRNRTLLGVGQ